MPGGGELVETNVRVPPCALQALTAVMGRNGGSRDATVRRLLAEHVQRQEIKHPEDRLTHISTVLRYPRQPRGRKQPRTGTPLRLRLPADLADRARAVSLHLPGQYPRAHRDYQSRALTDAVMTAIACAEPFTDYFLDGLFSLLRHRAAHNLWRLASVALCTRPEFHLLHAAEKLRDGMEGGSVQGLDLEQQRLLDTVAALEEDVAWHSPARFITAANIARERLTGPRAEENERMLYEEGEDFDALYRDTLHAREETRQKLLQGTADYDWSGRGGTAVWRAERQVTLQNFEDWLVDRTGTEPAQMLAAPPGWVLLRPDAWTAAAPALTRDGQIPQPFPQWQREGRVLTFPYRNRQALWPVQRIQRAPGWEPVPGIEALLAPARALPAEKVLGYIEALLIEWNHHVDTEEEPAFPSVLEISAGRAYDIGLITAEERRAAMAEAREMTLRGMDEVIARFESDGVDTESLQHLRAARGRFSEFKCEAKGIDAGVGSRLRVTRALWRWPGGSAAAEFRAGSSTDLVQWLATAAHQESALILELAMHKAWQDAFDRYGRRDRATGAWGRGRV
ncbi:hypothetical protein [Streptomyces sp. NBC_01022]|uniref:hypothetical protein n=1 Tax=Streptomyces sp. NBC_01022 TaxID=2903723 RepID=UPI002DD8F3A4|nr:hypothetical protein [Streptomyces sp. NBC_01022]WRZ81629.1 hypothetical protein OG316_15815 [Streptomyces sp. NBC_01022]